MAYIIHLILSLAGLEQVAPLGVNIARESRAALLPAAAAPRGASEAWCGEPAADNTVEELMVEFGRVDAALRAVLGAPNAARMHTYKAYAGPWVENYWIERFYKPDITGSPDAYRAHFGHFVPIFAQWVDSWLLRKPEYRDQVVPLLEKLLRPDKFVYITVSQNDQGVTGGFTSMDRLRGLLVLSAGGYGHVPIPLLKQPEKPLGPLSSQVPRRLLGFAGSPREGTRLDALNALESLGLPEDQFESYQGPLWREFLQTSDFCLAPRGFGRSVFILYEAIQMEACVPVFVYNDVEWLPYFDPPVRGIEIRSWVVSVQLGEIAKLPSLLSNISKPERDEMLGQMRRLRDSHFSYSGVMEQIRHFMANDAPSDLRCRSLPPCEH